jgi:hypothetical protein
MPPSAERNSARVKARTRAKGEVAVAEFGRFASSAACTHFTRSATTAFSVDGRTHERAREVDLPAPPLQIFEKRQGHIGRSRSIITCGRPRTLEVERTQVREELAKKRVHLEVDAICVVGGVVEV